MRQIICLLGLIYAQTLSAWNGEYWQYLNWKMWKKGPYQLSTIAECRLRSEVYYYRIAENFCFKALSHLDLEAHYSYIYNKPEKSKHFIPTSRVELEVNPWINLGLNATLKFRNRLELIKKQTVSHIQFVFRQRTSYKIPLDYGRINAFQCYDEVFYDFDTKKITQNRFVPLQLTVAINERFTIDIFAMIRNFKSSNQWYRSIIFGSDLGF